MSQSIIGQVIQKRYRVEAYIASGGMKTVYRVRDLERSVSLAMKVLHADLEEDPAMLRSFERETRAIKKLAHPNIVRFYGLEETDNGSLFMLEEFIDGPSLKDILKERKNLPIEEALIYFKALCAALGYAHSNGVVHCDVKPGNVMIDQGGNILLTDFGIARHAGSDSTSTFAGAGTPAYMAPEQVLKDPVTFQTDIYALGVMLFEMLTGQRPFRGTEAGLETTGSTQNERIRYAHLEMPPPNPRSLNPELPEKVGAAILTALSKNAKDRFHDVQTFLRAVCEGAGIAVEQIPTRVMVPERGGGIGVPVSPSRDWQKLWRQYGAYIILAGVVIIALAYIVFHQPNPTSILPTAVSQAAEATSLKNSGSIPSDTPVPTPISLGGDSPIIVINTLTAVTATPTKRLIPTDTQKITSCLGAEPQQVRVGDRVIVCTKSDRVIVRQNPEPGNNEEFRIYKNTEVEIIDGPACSDSSSWWKVRVPAGITVFHGADFMLTDDSVGWVREGSDNTDPYYICKVP